MILDPGDTVHYATPECLPEETWLQKRSPSTEVFGIEDTPAACEPVMAIGEIQLLTGAASVWYRCRALCLGFDLQTTYSLRSGAQHVSQSFALFPSTHVRHARTSPAVSRIDKHCRAFEWTTGPSYRDSIPRGRGKKENFRELSRTELKSGRVDELNEWSGGWEEIRWLCDDDREAARKGPTL